METEAKNSDLSLEADLCSYMQQHETRQAGVLKHKGDYASATMLLEMI